MANELAVPMSETEAALVSLVLKTHRSAVSARLYGKVSVEWDLQGGVIQGEARSTVHEKHRLTK